MKTLLYILITTLIISVSFTACETNRGEIIPYVRVDLYEHISSPPVVHLGIGESAIISGGYQGIIIYRDTDISYQAYDRTCTLWPEHTAPVRRDTTFEGVFQCPECQSQYLLINEGQVIGGPASYPLARYNAVVNQGILHIFN
jgi:Rieske Fe-S protein